MGPDAQSDDGPSLQELVDNLRADAVLQTGQFADELYAAADKIERLMGEKLCQGEVYDKIKGHAMTQSELGRGDFARYADEYNREHLDAEDKPIGFRTWDVPDPYAEGPQPVQPVTLQTRFVEWAFTRGDRNFTKLGDGYLLPEIQKAWLAFRAGAASLVQSDAKPVGDGSLHDNIMENYRLGIRPIGLIDEYFGFPSMTAPPRPDASAGLIEASILLDNRADEHKGKNDNVERSYRMAACFLRARAAERSGK